MQDTITLRGFVATDPITRRTNSGAPVAGFRLATTERRFDRDTGTWVDGHTNWYSISAFGQLGANTAQCVRKGNPVIITGRLRVRDWSTEERSGTSVDVVADAVGLDLGYGAVAFVRSQRSSAQGAGESTRPEAEGTEHVDSGHEGTGHEGAGHEGTDGFRTALPDAFGPDRDGEHEDAHPHAGSESDADAADHADARGMLTPA